MAKRSLSYLSVAALLIASFLVLTYYLLSDTARTREADVQVVEGKGGDAEALKTPGDTIGAAARPYRTPGTQRKGVPDLNADLTTVAFRHADMKSMHDRLRAEGRDDAWAKKAEEYFADNYAMLVGAVGSDWRPTVECGTTLCEVSGVLPSEKDAEIQASLQSGDLMMDSWEHGYHNMGAVFSSGKDGRAIALTYYQREGPSTFNPDEYSPEWRARHKK